MPAILGAKLEVEPGTGGEGFNIEFRLPREEHVDVLCKVGGVAVRATVVEEGVIAIGRAGDNDDDGK